jgi:hypothetical protein
MEMKVVPSFRPAIMYARIVYISIVVAYINIVIGPESIDQGMYHSTYLMQLGRFILRCYIAFLLNTRQSKAQVSVVSSDDAKPPEDEYPKDKNKEQQP